MFLVLNQNNSSSTETSHADINKLHEIFRLKNSYQLPQAYDINQLDNGQIHILNKNEKVLKRRSKPDFMKECTALLDTLFGSIRKKGDDFKTMPEVV